MSKLTYWERRQVEDMYHYMSEAEKKADEIAKLYLRASRYLSLKADDIFEKYQAKYGLSEAEARRLLNLLVDKASLDEMLQKLQSCKNSKEKQELLKELEAPAYQARLEHFRQMQNELDMVMRDIYQQEKQISTSFYVDIANESYYRNIFNIQQNAGVAFSFAHVSADAIEQVINSNWSGKNYSERIWNNTEALAQSLKEELLLNLVTGRSNREAARVIMNKFGQSSFHARRLIRTESSFVSGEMNLRAYKACGIEKYRFLATLDLRTSQKCRELDGKIFLVSEAKVGVNHHPMHPFCRSTTTSVVDEELLKKWTRSARDPVTGKTMKVPATMTYNEWYQKYVKGNKDAETEEKKIRNRESDRKQHEEYRKVLGKEIPEKLDDFQNMKYNEGEKWEEYKELYKVNNQYKVVRGSVSPRKVAELHEIYKETKLEFSGKFKSQGNVSVAQCNGKEYIAHSKASNENSPAFKAYKGEKEFAFLEKDRQFKTMTIKGWDRAVDGEAKIFERLNKQYGNRDMQIYMNSGYPMCDSCKSVAEQYELLNPKVKVNIIERKGME